MIDLGTKVGGTLYEEQKIIAFWGGVFSNWYDSDITVPELDNAEINTAEQGMMLWKAKHFNDQVTYDKILREKNPRDQKALGRQVANFDAEEWDKVCKDYVAQILCHKFTQNEALKRLILMTKGYTLVEASPYDTIWGVGMMERDPDVAFPDRWKGKNYLGEVLMQVRDRIAD